MRLIGISQAPDGLEAVIVIFFGSATGAAVTIRRLDLGARVSLTSAEWGKILASVLVFVPFRRLGLRYPGVPGTRVGA